MQLTSDIVQSNIGLFPDIQTVIAGPRQMVSTHRVDVVDMQHREMQKSDWDSVVVALLATNLVFST